MVFDPEFKKNHRKDPTPTTRSSADLAYAKITAKTHSTTLGPSGQHTGNRITTRSAQKQEGRIHNNFKTEFFFIPTYEKLQREAVTLNLGLHIPCLRLP